MPLIGMKNLRLLVDTGDFFFLSFILTFLFFSFLLARTRWRSVWGSAVRGGDENRIGAALVIIYCRGRTGEGENPCFIPALISGPLGVDSVYTSTGNLSFFKEKKRPGVSDKWRGRAGRRLMDGCLISFSVSDPGGFFKKPRFEAQAEIYSPYGRDCPK